MNSLSLLLLRRSSSFQFGVYQPLHSINPFSSTISFLTSSSTTFGSDRSSSSSTHKCLFSSNAESVKGDIDEHLMGKIKGVKRNWQIHAPVVRLLGRDGTDRGVFSLEQAVEYAKDRGVDLVSITNATPETPTICKLMDFKEFQAYKEGLSSKRSSDKAKEIFINSEIDEHDLQLKLIQMAKFIIGGFLLDLKLFVKKKKRGAAVDDYASIALQLLKSILQRIDADFVFVGSIVVTSTSASVRIRSGTDKKEVSSSSSSSTPNSGGQSSEEEKRKRFLQDLDAREKKAREVYEKEKADKAQKEKEKLEASTVSSPLANEEVEDDDDEFEEEPRRK